jgi:hypothetical protein
MSRVPSIVLGLALVVAAAAAAVLLNLLLLDRASARNDPVGKLTPRTHLPAAPQWTIRPTRGHVEDRGADD